MKALHELAVKDKGLAHEVRSIHAGLGVGGVMGYLGAMMWRDEITSVEYVRLCDEAMAIEPEEKAAGVQS